ncbi:hypothetical protein CFP71_04510 [Amycolatopsis thailandensis]|uniref:Terminal beta-(1->2)-arabinofuranosyltransferase C-terminal domain-containing protein n=1 Tax=Amycolatopsis thailandensis TaxID=589330 RepID=A0A229SGX7_9PSEU|nr:hypothetical protein [Amycolatopsis thailandensis]OXM57974.1 hypothetical protein CFP71_04510 [Amycolatopsis thailandensis]
MSTTGLLEAESDVTRAWYRRPRVWTWILFGLAAVVFAELAWRRRWMSDDGLIVLRTVRNLLEGDGPVFNAGERVEANTSTLWTFIVAGLGLLGIKLEWAAVLSGLVLAVAGLWFAMDGARRFHRPTGSGLAVPAGALLVCVLPPFRDFATSGLETGLITFWLGLTWWLVVRLALDGDTVRAWPVALVIGLGPLVRPDLALFSALAFIGMMVAGWRGWKHLLGLLAVAGALPVAYQIFRMGYYGLLTPNTALAKEASSAHWGRGWRYLADLVSPYYLWVPVLLLAAGLVLLLRRVPRNRALWALIAFPLLSGLALALYVIRLGGDFMHGRMLLPALFAALLPVMALPFTRWTAVVLAGVGVWGVVALGWLRVPYEDAPKAYNKASGIADERGYWSAVTRHEHPVTIEDYMRSPDLDLPVAMAAVRNLPGPSVLVYRAGAWRQYASDKPYSTVFSGSIGAFGLVMPRDVRVHDGYGLVNSIASHTTLVFASRSGHEKDISPTWAIGEAGRTEVDATGDANGFAAEDILAARKAVQCPEVREMLDSVRAPLTAGRFWDNLTGAVGRNSLRYPADPRQAADCG